MRWRSIHSRCAGSIWRNCLPISSSPSSSSRWMTDLLGELLQKAHVSGVEVAYVGDAVLDHGDAFHAHAEGEAGDLFGVVGGRFALRGALLVDCGEDGGVHHAAAEELNPAGVFALAAAFAGAEGAGDLDVGRGLGEGEEAGEEARLDGRAEQRLHGVVECAL